MSYLKKRLKRWGGCGRMYVAISILALGMVTGTLVPGFAQDLPAIKPINPVPGMPSHWIFSGEDPPVYVKVGVLDRLGDKEVVVDDSLIRFSSDKQVTFYSKYSASEISRSDFKKGDLVGYELGEDGLLMVLWLLDN